MFSIHCRGRKRRNAIPGSISPDSSCTSINLRVALRATNRSKLKGPLKTPCGFVARMALFHHSNGIEAVPASTRDVGPASGACDETTADRRRFIDSCSTAIVEVCSTKAARANASDCGHERLAAAER